MMAPSNPLSLALLEELGATTANIPSDATLDQLAEFRAASSLPIDLYVESPEPVTVHSQQVVAQGAVDYLTSALKAPGGVILIPRTGEPRAAFNTPAMPWAMRA